MAELKKYTSFDALKSDQNSGKDVRIKEKNLSEFEAFLKQLKSEYSNKRKNKTENGKQPG